MSEMPFKNSKYKLISKISDGGSSHIFLVEYEGKQYAFKALKTPTADSLLRFRRESSTLARLNHPHLVKLIDAGVEGDNAYLVMEYLDGPTLAGRLLKDKTISQIESVQIITTIADALSEIHRNNLVHRDVKPGNILLSSGGVKLIDLGLVGDVEQIKTETALVGTPLYCSPEQTKILNRNVTFSSDLYSLGIVFYEILTGAPPFTGSLSDILQQHTSTPVPNLRMLRPDLRESVIVIIEKLLAKDPDDRYQSSANLIYDLGRLDEIDQLLSQKKDAKLDGKEKQSFAVRIKYIERKDEIEKLYWSWNAAKTGHPGLYIVKGASGSGKSRLCSEFIARALHEGKNEVLILKGKSQFSNQDMPFGAIREALDSLISAAANDTIENQTEIYKRIASAAEGREGHLLKFSKSLHKVFKKKAAENIETDIEGEKEKYYSSIADFFVKLSQQWKGLILFLDDLQWLDGSSLQLIERLMGQSGENSIFILGTARNDEKSAAAMKNLEEVLGASIKGQLEIGGFSKDQMASLLSSYLGAAQLEGAIVDFLYSKSTGNPFIAAEYLRAVVEQGFLIFKDNQWKMAGEGLEKVAFSSDVYELIVKRIEGGSTALKSFLRFASLYGNSFTAPDIAAAAQIEKSHLNDVLGEGERLGLLDRLDETRWKFSHDKIPESLRQSLDPAQTKKMCDQLTQFYRQKETLTDDEIFILARLAYSGNFEKNLEFTVKANTTAGFLSLANHAHGQAFIFLKCAFDLSEKIEIERALLLEMSSKLAICAAMISNWPVAEKCVQKALDISQGKEELAHSLGLKVWVKKTHGDITTAWESFRKACDVLGKPYPAYFHWKLLTTLWLFFASMFLNITNLRLGFLFPPESKRGKSLRQMADLYFEAQYCSEYRQLLDFSLVSLKILLIGQMTGRKRELALGYASTGYALASLGVRGLAVPFLNKAVLLSEELNDPVFKAACISRKIEGFLSCGATYDETTEYMKNIDFAKRYLSPTDLGRLRNNRAMILIFKGRNVEANNFLKTYVNLQNPAASKAAVIPMLNGLHVYWFNLSLLGLAHEAQEAKRIALKTCSPYRFVPVAHRHISVYELQTRRYTEEVDELVNDLREHYMGNFSSFTEMGGKLNFSQMVFLDLFELDRAKNREEKFSMRKKFKTNLQRLYFMLYSPLYRINYYILKAMYYRVVGKFSVAEKWLRKCEKIAEATGHIRLMFEIQREHARIHQEQGDLMLTKAHLMSALQMASENQWRLTEESLIAEFGSMAEQLVINWSGKGRSTDQTATVSINQVGTQSLGQSLGQTNGQPSINSLTRQSGTEDGGQNPEQVRFVDALLKVSHAFVSSLDMMEQSKSVLTQIVKLFAAERGFVFIKNEETNEHKPLTGKNAQGEDLPHLSGYSSTVVKKVFETGQPVIITNSDEAEALGSESAVLYNLRSIIITPLMIKDRVLGAVYLDSSLMKGLFSKKDTQLFSTLANNISVAIELSRMAKVELEKAALRKELEIQAAVATESKKVKVLVDNMQQALFSIAADGTIVEPVSKFAQVVLGRPVVGEKLIEALYRDVSDKEALSGIDTALNTVFGEDELQWDLMADQFPRKIHYSLDGDKTLRVQPSPVWDGAANLEKIVFVVEDVTVMEDLERKVKEQGVQASLLSEILENDFQDLEEFMSEADAHIGTLRKLGAAITPDNFATILRDLHTFKGHARLFKLSTVSGQIHGAESALLVFKDNLKDKDTVKNEVMAEITKIESSLKLYKDIFQRISPSRNVGGTGVTELALKNLTGIVADIQDDLPAKKLQKLSGAVKRLSFKSVRDMAQKYSAMVSDISRQLGKKVKFSVDGDSLISQERSQLLKECLLHLLRNSIDHGFEEGSARIQAGKSDVGHLSVLCQEEKDGVTISISDDGSGIDGDQVLKRAIQRGLISDAQGQKMSADDKVNLIFSPNFSTKAEVSEISGRGIGLDVVKKNIEAMNGELKVITEKGKGSKFLIRLGNETAGAAKVGDKSRAAG